jgi:hypothetical protein
MDLFTVIDDATAIVRMPKGVLKQTKVYSRGERVFVPHSGGFIRLTAPFGDTFGTSHPDIKVVEISQDVPGLFVTGEPRYRAPMRAAA